MWELAIGFVMGQIKMQAEFEEMLRRDEALALCSTPESYAAQLAEFRRIDAEAAVERRHQETLKAIRDAAPKVTINHWY